MVDKIVPIVTQNDNQSLTQAERRSLESHGIAYARQSRELSQILLGERGQIIPQAVADNINYVAVLIMSNIQRGDLQNALSYLSDTSVPPSLEEVAAAAFRDNSSTYTRGELRGLITELYQERAQFVAEMRSEGATQEYINAVLDSLAQTYERTNNVDVTLTMAQVGNTGRYSEHDQRIGITARGLDNEMAPDRDDYNNIQVPATPADARTPNNRDGRSGPT